MRKREQRKWSTPVTQHNHAHKHTHTHTLHTHTLHTHIHTFQAVAHCSKKKPFTDDGVATSTPQHAHKSKQKKKKKKEKKGNEGRRKSSPAKWTVKGTFVCRSLAKKGCEFQEEIECCKASKRNKNKETGSKTAQKTRQKKERQARSRTERHGGPQQPT